jgi:hypothetical protein
MLMMLGAHADDAADGELGDDDRTQLDVARAAQAHPHRARPPGAQGVPPHGGWLRPGFVRATGQARGFFKLPYEYFTQRWHLQLNLAGKATLLICLAQAPTFTLPTEHAARWYGVSADTLQRGLDELRELGLLKVWSRAKKAPVHATASRSKTTTRYRVRSAARPSRSPR